MKRQTISVAVSQAAAGGLNLASLTNLVTSAAGVDTARGDVVTVEVVPFSTAAADDAAKASPRRQGQRRGRKAGRVLRNPRHRRQHPARPADPGPGRHDHPAPPPEARAGGPRRTPGPGDHAGGPARHGPARPHLRRRPSRSPPCRRSRCPSTEQMESERRRFEIDSMVAANPERAADYLRSLMDDRQPV